MPYQNNNNRIVPKEALNTRLNPVSSPTNQEIKYQVDLSKARKTAQTSDALMRLGQGVLDVDYLLDRKAQDDIIAAEYETEAQGGNKKEWADVSRNVRGMAKFNPYNKEAFRRLQANDIYREALIELSTYPDLEKLDPEKFYQIKQDKAAKMFQSFKETGLSPKDYASVLMTWDENVKKIEMKYASDHAEFDFNQLIIKETSDGTTELEAELMNVEDDAMKPSIFRQVIDKRIHHLDTETGIVAPATQAKVVMSIIKNYIARNVSQIDDTEVLAAVTDLTLGNGKKLNEVIPNYDIAIKDLLSQAREANLRQMKLEVETKDFQQQQLVKDVMSDFMQQTMDGKLRSPDEVQNYAKAMCEKYGLDGINSMKMFQELATGRKLWTDLADVETDPRVGAYLGMKVIQGTATYDEIASAIGNGTLNYKDGYQMMQNMHTREQKIQNETDKLVQKHLKDVDEEFLKGSHSGDKDISAVLLDPDDQQAFAAEVQALANQYEQTKDYKTFNNNLALLKSSYKQAIKEMESGQLVRGMAKGYENLKATPQISDAQWARMDINKSTQALRQMGLVRTNLMNNKDMDVTVASAPQKSRKITVTDAKGNTYTKNTRHTGYDLKSPNLYMGKKIHPPMNNCVVVGVLTEEQNRGMGNMVLLKCPNGKFIKYMHLQKADLPSLGTVLGKESIVGHMGNSGDVGSKAVGSLHVEFYDANHQWITAWEFMKR